MGGRVDALAVVATESPYISEAIDTLMEQQIPVVALLTDLSAANLAGYVGIDNRMAGRTPPCPGSRKTSLVCGRILFFG